ncbi:hypothetical protein GH714_041142 [Hevea brasiliensis]|uniref:RNase H type-1 domain-containing protein n=1 Tax=Hevea brasiliensis TaxID=3981 RepID=A0A6A6MXJ0_HEVBR|nr:hypothetical protein GH714_041142 [Hevea brasiliensis]
MAWSLVVNPDSLAARLLKAKYYLESSFLTAPLGSSLSYIWHSIHATQSLIRSGLCWHIGTGNQVNIWNDKVWNGKLLTAYQVWQRANFAFHEWQINVDATTTILDFRFGVGFVARDWNGSFLAAKNVVLQSNLMAKEAEVLVCECVAHRLARVTHFVSDVGEWIDHPLDFIVQALSEDFY